LRLLELLAVAVVGGGLALGGAALLGKLGGGTTIEQVTSGAQTVPAALKSGQPASPGLTTSTPSTHTLTAEQIYTKDGPGVVQITATSVQSQTDPFGLIPSTPQTSQSLGSGFVIDKAGHIVTNYHVIEGAQKVQVSFTGQDELAAKLVGEDRSTDVAVLKVNEHARALTPLPLGASGSVVVGDPVYAIGNPFGLTRTLTTGVVSAVQRQIIAPNSVQIDNVIQTDAAINHGNSGGPLIDRFGNVIGVTSQIETGSNSQSGNVGIGFAIPIDTVRSVAAQIISSGRARHAFLGVSTLPVNQQLVQLFRLPVKKGLLVQEVTKGSAAAKVGIKAGPTRVVVQGESYQVGGDILVAVDHQRVTTQAELFTVVNRHQPGDKISVELYHQGKRKTVTVTLGDRPGT
jgi:S1-C subfamily serine protease